MTDVGISDDFIKSVRDEVTPGTSALFLMSQNAVADRVRSAFAETQRPAHPHAISATSRKPGCARPSAKRTDWTTLDLLAAEFSACWLPSVRRGLALSRGDPTASRRGGARETRCLLATFPE